MGCRTRDAAIAAQDKMGLSAKLEHPMYLGVLLGLWATPQMSVGHAVLAAQLTLYIAVGMRYERRDLRRRFGRSYEAWRNQPIAPHVGLLSIDVSDLVRDPLPPRIARLLQQLDSLDVGTRSQLFAITASPGSGRRVPPPARRLLAAIDSIERD